MATIRLQNLTKQFDDVVAVSGIDLEIREGEFLVLVGPSGCGKSTTLRLVAGLEDVSDGTLTIGDRRVNDLPPEERDVAMVFQNYALYPHMTARENMSFGASSGTDFSGAEIDERVERAAGILDIEPLLDRKPGELSGGERQRVAIGRTLVREPEVFLMDEPLSNLDAKLRIQMRAELAELHQRLQTTTLYVTHDQTEAMTLGDRVAVMNDGRIEQVDPPQKLYDYPDSRFVAEFIGSPGMNVLEVHSESTGDGCVLRRGDVRIDVPGATGVDDGTVLLGVRPEDVHLTGADANGNPTDPFAVGVSVTEPLGNSLLVHGEVDGAGLKMQLPPRTDVDAGTELDVTIDGDRLHVFDAASGEALYHTGETRADDADPAGIEESRSGQPGGLLDR